MNVVLHLPVIARDTPHFHGCGMSWLVGDADYELPTASGRLLSLLVGDGAIYSHGLKSMGKADALAAHSGAGDVVFYDGSVAAFWCLGKKGGRWNSLSNSLLMVG